MYLQQDPEWNTLKDTLHDAIYKFDERKMDFHDVNDLLAEVHPNADLLQSKRKMYNATLTSNPTAMMWMSFLIFNRVLFCECEGDWFGYLSGDSNMLL